ncbi:hypothetical protein C4D60_Mb04t35330 [Musa balbisiana]|uniref:Uncharacterized protein n=1 Tax=Musa balbisiana TaxID=52838 RepID=A0A4S8KH52_MUSBA|nr:hypothetical protein C4D60_Mb04t35330 [Musa balbisiana]
MGTILSWISRCRVFTGERLGFASGIAWCSGPNIGSETERRCHRPLVVSPIKYPSAGLSKTLWWDPPVGPAVHVSRFTEAPWITAVGRHSVAGRRTAAAAAAQIRRSATSHRSKHQRKEKRNEGGRDCLLCTDHSISPSELISSARLAGNHAAELSACHIAVQQRGPPRKVGPRLTSSETLPRALLRIHLLPSKATLLTPSVSERRQQAASTRMTVSQPSMLQRTVVCLDPKDTVPENIARLEGKVV